MNDMQSIKYTLLLLLSLNILFSKDDKKNDIYLTLFYRNPEPHSNQSLSIKSEFVIPVTDYDRHILGDIYPLITLIQGNEKIMTAFEFFHRDNLINMRRNRYLYLLRGKNIPISSRRSALKGLNTKKTPFKMQLKLLDKYKNVIEPHKFNSLNIEFSFPLKKESLSKMEFDSLEVWYNLNNLKGTITKDKLKNKIHGCKLIYENNMSIIICDSDYESTKSISQNNKKSVSKSKTVIASSTKIKNGIKSPAPSNNSNTEFSTDSYNPTDKGKTKLDIQPILPNTNELGKSPLSPVVNENNVADIILPDSKDIPINETTIIDDPHSLIYISNGNSMRNRNFNWYSTIRNTLFDEISNSHYLGSRLSIATGADSSTSSIYMPFTNGGARTEELKNAEIKAGLDRPLKETQNLYEILIKSQSLLGPSDKIKYQNLDLIIFFATEWSFSPNSIDDKELKITLDSLSKTFNNIHLIYVSENALSRNKEFDENFVSILSDRPDILRHDIVKENIEMIGEKLKSFVKSKS